MAIETAQILDPWDLLVLADRFPPGLNTATPPTDIGVDESPDCYGVSLSRDGRLSKGTIPSGTARVERSVTISTVPYKWHYGRLWNITGQTASTASNTLIYGAYGYDDVYVPFKSGKMMFNEDSATLLATVPVGGDSLLLPKTTGSYVLGNLNDTRGFWQKSDLIQELACAAATYVTELDEVAYVSNANGLFAYQQGQVVELTRKVRDGLTNFASKALTVDYAKKYIIGGTTFVYEPATEKIFRYSGSNFLYTSKQFKLPDYRPFCVEGVSFTIERSGTEDGWIEFSTRIEDGDWSDTFELNIPYAAEQYTMVTAGLAYLSGSNRFQLRITDMSTNIYVKRIVLNLRDFNPEDYRA